jgi:hypothetical protein
LAVDFGNHHGCERVAGNRRSDAKTKENYSHDDSGDAHLQIWLALISEKPASNIYRKNVVNANVQVKIREILFAIQRQPFEFA